MGGKRNKDWSREETILALDLYYRLPIKDIRDYTPEIISLSEILGRSPGAVKAKLWNLAGCDPKRPGKSLVHGSATGRLVFDEFFDREDDLACEAARIKTVHYKLSIPEEESHIPLGENRSQTVQARIKQDFFRQAVLAAYANRCCITGISARELLIASHIKPWAQSDSRERTNPCNGLALNPLHDRAFDRGLITVRGQGAEYRILVSSELKKAKMDEATRDWMQICHGHSIALPTRFVPCREFLEYHNDMIFLG